MCITEAWTWSTFHSIEVKPYNTDWWSQEPSTHPPLHTCRDAEDLCMDLCAPAPLIINNNPIPLVNIHMHLSTHMHVHNRFLKTLTTPGWSQQNNRQGTYSLQHIGEQLLSSRRLLNHVGDTAYFHQAYWQTSSLLQQPPLLIQHASAVHCQHLLPQKIFTSGSLLVGNKSQPVEKEPLELLLQVVFPILKATDS